MFNDTCNFSKEGPLVRVERMSNGYCRSGNIWIHPRLVSEGIVVGLVRMYVTHEVLSGGVHELRWGTYVGPVKHSQEQHNEEAHCP